MVKSILIILFLLISIFSIGQKKSVPPANTKMQESRMRAMNLNRDSSGRRMTYYSLNNNPKDSTFIGVPRIVTSFPDGPCNTCTYMRVRMGNKTFKLRGVTSNTVHVGDTLIVYAGYATKGYLRFPKEDDFKDKGPK